MKRIFHPARRVVHLSALLFSGLLIACNTAAPLAGGDGARVDDDAPVTLPPPTVAAPDLPDLGPAPDFVNEVWFNSEPLTLASLEDKVVLVEFWTFG